MGTLGTQRGQTIARDAHRGLCLSRLGTSVPSPYFQPTVTRKEALDRVTKITTVYMIGIIDDLTLNQGTTSYGRVTIVNNGDVVAKSNIEVDLTGVSSFEELADAFISSLDTFAANNSVTLTGYSFGGSFGDVELATVATSGSYNDLLNKPTIPSVDTLSFANPSRTLNSAFQVSATRAAFVSYTVDIAATLSLVGGQTGTVSLQYANDSGFTSGVTTVQSAVNGNTGTLSLGLNITQTGTASVSGIIPAGKYVRLATANTVGSPSFVFRAAQEVLMPSN